MGAVYTLVTSGARTPDVRVGPAGVTVLGLRRGLLSLLVLVIAIALATVADRAADRPLHRSANRSAPVEADLSPPPQQAPATTAVTAPAAAPAPPASCPEWSDGTPGPEAAPIAAKLAPYLLDPRLQDNDVSVSVWIDGIGEVASLNGDQRLNVASNQKLLTAMGVLSEFDLGTTFHTSINATSVDAAGVVAGDLVLVGGGDPTLTSTGPHSLMALAAAVRTAGVTEVRGRVLADESRYEPARYAPGWLDWQIPTYVGPLSAVIVDDNRRRVDSSFLANPAQAHAEAFRQRLIDAGISVHGPAQTGQAPAGSHPLAEIDSSPVGDLLARMLLSSDNEIAESLTREAGVLLAGSGSTAAGTAALEHGLSQGCAPIAAGGWADGSGLSRSDFRSARELRRLIQYARTQPWWPALEARLPVAGETGTLAARFRGTAAQHRVEAKTGTIIGGGALTGVIHASNGRDVVFSYLVNGESAPTAVAALDRLVVALAQT
ncbi:MAG TPA: D-alanyl-D-alanine carboxypeptidase/D-alanyl-D-alanine-endopeptidase [Acidimicrobiales bacterium]|nr:D-alanyl-D-alanine carboxypeptidase/D-alanyl-D-alanine-endopeptidase [Acidimicrobiales bacterium]